MSQATLIDKRWPNLRWQGNGHAQLMAVEGFLAQIEDPEVARTLHDDFFGQLAYLNGYGGTVSEDDPRRRFIVELRRDFAPLSFLVLWWSLVHDTGERTVAMQGGLIYGGGPSDPRYVSLRINPRWSVHT